MLATERQWHGAVLDSAGVEADKAATQKEGIMPQMVEVIKPPREAMHLKGKQGLLVQNAKGKGGLICVKVGDNFTYLPKNHVKYIRDRG